MKIGSLKMGYRMGLDLNNKTDIFVNFVRIHRFLTHDLKLKDNEGELKSQTSHLANTYHSYKSTQHTYIYITPCTN